MGFNEWFLSHDGWFEKDPVKLKQAWQLLEDDGMDGETIGVAFDLVGSAIAAEFEG